MPDNATTASTKDTEGVTGSPGPAPTGTAQNASNANTQGAQGGSRSVEPGSPPVTPFDTTGAVGGISGPTTSTAYTGTPDTLQPGPAGRKDADPVYRAPAVTGVPATVRDTTLTDKQPGGSVTNPVPTSMNYTGNQDSNTIGAAGTNTGPTPAAPTGVTAVTGPRGVTVSWTAVADPAGDPIQSYLITSSAGGTRRAPKNATSFFIDTLDPSRTYTFQVAARNRGGVGPQSTASSPVRPYNPDEPDVLKPGGYSQEVLTNGVYRPDGTLKPGTGGTNGAPGTPVATPGAASSKQVSVAFTAPTVGSAPTSYTVRSSTGVTATGASSPIVVTFPSSGATGVTFTVTATNAKGGGVTSAASNAVTVP